jgi:EAL and modified HD-GYP domain-containing signal transduction protein
MTDREFEMNQSTLLVDDGLSENDWTEAAEGAYQVCCSVDEDSRRISSEPGGTDVLVGRQPILNRRGKTVAYELLFRSSAENRCVETDGAMATRSVIRNSFLTIGSNRVLASKPGFINFPRPLLMDRSALCLSSDHVVVEIPEDVEPDEEVVAACMQLKARGYRIALDDISDINAFAPLLKYADYAKIEFPALGQQDRRRFCDHFRQKGLTVLAEKVETRADFQSALKDGYQLFQGYYFAQPEILSGRQVPTSKLARLRLLSEIQNGNLNFGRLEKIVRRDVGLVRMLLCFVNSAIYYSWRSVESIAQAFVWLGEENIRKWVTLAALPALAHGQPPEIVTTALVRAKFCELLAKHTGRGNQSSACFLMGMLSLIDAMIGLPMEQLLNDMALDKSISGAILAAPNDGRGLRPFLDLALCFEKLDVDGARQPAELLKVPMQEASQLYLAAISCTDAKPR